MVDAVMDETAHVQLVVTAQAVCVNNAVWHDFLMAGSNASDLVLSSTTVLKTSSYRFEIPIRKLLCLRCECVDGNHPFSSPTHPSLGSHHQKRQPVFDLLLSRRAAGLKLFLIIADGVAHRRNAVFVVVTHGQVLVGVAVDAGCKLFR